MCDDDYYYDDDAGELLPCPECGVEINEEVSQCPHCGMYVIHDNHPLQGRAWTLPAAVALIVLTVVVFYLLVGI